MKQIGIWRITALVSNLPETERWLASVPGRDDPGDANLLEEIKRVQGWAKPEEELRLEFKPVDMSKLFSEPMYGNCCSWGPSELYDDHEKLLKLVLEDDIKQWDTGWAGCKKEIVSFRAARDGDEVVCQASCSDDFDTEGNGEVVIHLDARETFQGDWVEHSYERILEAWGDAWDEADSERRDNEVYVGFSVMLILGPEDQDGPWVETLILPVDGDLDAPPPGDNYHEWGFQEETEILPQELLERIREWAEGTVFGESADSRQVFELNEPITYERKVPIELNDIPEIHRSLGEGAPGYKKVPVQVTRVMVKRWEEG